MKSILVCVMILFCLFCGAGCSEKSNSVVRIHIRANSNSEEDQSIKLSVRDSIIEYITPLLSTCNNSSEVKDILGENLDSIENVANEVLISNGFDYSVNARICNEYFPSREYSGDVYPADFYDALILELGTGKGDNWWCVAYPPLCFVGEDVEGSAVRYKSKLIEMINEFFGG